MAVSSMNCGAGSMDADESVPDPSPAADVVADPLRAAGAPSGWDYRLTVLRHYKAVFGYSAAILGSVADAEDVTQETFLRYGLRGGGVRRTREWLLSVARNLCFDRFRAAARTTALEPEMLDSLPAADEPVRTLERGQFESRLMRSIAALPEPQRSLVVLFDVQGMTGDECARLLGLSGNQVKVYLHRARRRLRQHLGRSQD